MFSPSFIISEILGTDEHTSFEIFVVLFTLFLGLLIILLVFYCLRYKSSKKSIYILGVSDAGKSVLFSKLVTKGQANVQTVTSQAANVFDGYVTVKKGRSMRLIDVPGADKVRSSILSSSIAKFPATGLVFVVDSTTVVQDSRSAAEWLYSILADHFDGRPPPLLVACAKQDAPGAKSARVIRTALEREFGALNRTRGAAPDATSGGASKRTLFSGNRRQNEATSSSESFDFDALTRGCTFVECSSLADPCDLGAVEDWLDDI